MRGIDHVRHAVEKAVKDSCWPWPKCRDRKGYGVLNNGGTRTLAHRLACEMFHGPAPQDKPVAAHACGRRDYINPHHVRWATYAENEEDKIAHGTSNRGESNGHAVLTPGDIPVIRARCANGEKQTSVARAFGVNRATVGDIVYRRTWGWLT